MTLSTPPSALLGISSFISLWSPKTQFLNSMVGQICSPPRRRRVFNKYEYLPLRQLVRIAIRSLAFVFLLYRRASVNTNINIRIPNFVHFRTRVSGIQYPFCVKLLGNLIYSNSSSYYPRPTQGGIGTRCIQTILQLLFNYFKCQLLNLPSHLSCIKLHVQALVVHCDIFIVIILPFRY